MNVSMTLSLVDTASPQVKAFMEQLAALEGVVASVGSKMAGFAAGMESFAASLGLVKASAAGVSAEIGAVGASAGAASVETARLESTIAGLNAALQSVLGKLAGVAAGMADLGAASTAASAGASGAMNALGTGAQAANTHVNTLADSIRGMALLWTAFELKKGMKSSIHEASDFQKEMLTIEGLNLGDAANKEIAEKAWKDSQGLGFVSPVDALRARQAAIGGLAQPMNQEVLDATVPAALKLTNNLRFAGDKTELADMVRNLYGIAEARQQTEDPKAMLDTFDFVQKAFTATQGKVTPKDIEMFVRQLGQGASNISDDGLMRAVAAIDQMKIAGGANGGGGGASKYGTAYKMLQAYAMGKPMNKQGAAILMESGILEPGSIDADGNTTLSANIKPGGAKDQQLASQDINAWMAKNAPNIIAYTRKHAKEYYQGADMDDPKAIETAVQKYLTALGITVTAQQAASLPINPRSQARMEEQRDMQIKSKGVNDQSELIKDSYAQSTTRFSKALAALGQTIGEILMPVLTPLINGLASLLEKLAGFSNDHPVVAFALTLGAAFIGISAAIKGFALVFGPIAALLGLTAESFGILGVAVMAARNWFGLLVAGIGIGARAILAYMGPLGWIIAGIVLVWEAGLGDWISKLNVFGHSVGDWASSMANDVVNTFRNMWVRTKQFFGYLSEDAAKAQVEANNTARNDKQKALGFGSQESSGKINYGGATTSPAGKPKTRAEQIREQQLADAENVKLGPHVDKKMKGSAGGGGRFKNYDPDLDDAKNAFRLEEDDLRRHGAAEDELYKANKISIAEFYDDKLATTRKGINAQIAELEREQAAYRAQGDKAGVNRVGTDITIKKRDLADAEKSVEVQREKDLNALKKEGIALEAQMLEAEGKKKQSHMAREIADLEEKKKKFLLNPTAPDSAKNADLAQQAIDTAKLTAAMDEYKTELKQVQDAAKTGEEQITDAVKSGALSEVFAQDKKFELRKKEAAQLDELIAKYRELILASDAPQEIKDIQLRSLKLEQAKANTMANELSPDDARMKQGLDSSVEGGFATFFKDIITGSKSAKNAFKDFANSIAATVNDLVAKKLAKQLFESIFGKEGVPMSAGGTGGSSGGGGDVFGSIMKMFSMSGGSSGGSASANAGASGFSASLDALNGAGSAIVGLATGTDRVPQDMLAMIHQGEMIIPAYDAEKVRAGGAGGQRPMQVNNHFTVSGPVTRETQMQIGQQAGLGIQRAARRNG
jgi:hypothetical protein